MRFTKTALLYDIKIIENLQSFTRIWRLIKCIWIFYYWRIEYSYKDRDTRSYSLRSTAVWQIAGGTIVLFVIVIFSMR